MGGGGEKGAELNLDFLGHQRYFLLTLFKGFFLFFFFFFFLGGGGERVRKKHKKIVKGDNWKKKNIYFHMEVTKEFLY